MQSRVHPTYKTKYRVANQASYDRALVRQGDVIVWVSPEAIANWEPAGVDTRGGQRTCSDLAIETGADAPASLPLATPPDRGVSAVALGADGTRPSRARSHDADDHLVQQMGGVRTFLSFNSIESKFIDDEETQFAYHRSVSVRLLSARAAVSPISRPADVV
jgi:hypothetical protein